VNVDDENDARLRRAGGAPAAPASFLEEPDRASGASRRTAAEGGRPGAGWAGRKDVR